MSDLISIAFTSDYKLEEDAVSTKKSAEDFARVEYRTRLFFFIFQENVRIHIIR